MPECSLGCHKGIYQSDRICFLLPVQTGSAHRLVAPEMIKAAKISSKLSEYAYNNNPVGTKASKNFKITSVTAKKNSETLTIKTNKKLNDTQVFAIKYIYINDTYLQNDKKAVFNVYVKDTKTGHYYRGTAYAKQGRQSDQRKNGLPQAEIKYKISGILHGQ